MSFLTPDFVTSRANNGLLSPRNLTTAMLKEQVETLSFFFGEERLMREIEVLTDSLDDDMQFPESLLSYVSLFGDPAEVYVNAVGVSNYIQKKEKFFKVASKERSEVPLGYRIGGEKKESGRHMYYVLTLESEEGVWVDAPVGKPDLAVQKAKPILDLMDKGRFKDKILNEGYFIPRYIDPEEFSRSGDMKDFDESYQSYSRALEGSRSLRLSARANSKVMTTPGFGNAGTYWKFDPILKYLVKEANLPDEPLVLLAGTGKYGHSGMCAAVLKYLPNAQVVAYEPLAIDTTYCNKWDLRTECLSPDEYEGPEPDLVVTDVAVGQGRSFDVTYTTRFAAQLFKRFKCPMVFKDSIEFLGRRKFARAFFGRGHNTEVFLVRNCGIEGYASQHQLLSLLEQKRGCDLARNLFHCFKIRAPCKVIEEFEPQPYRVGNKVCKPWSKHRLYNSGLTVTGYVRLLAGFDVTTLPVNEPVRNLVEMVRTFMFVAPDTDIGHLLGTSRKLFANVKVGLGKGKNFTPGKNKPEPRRRHAHKRLAVEAVQRFFDQNCRV